MPHEPRRREGAEEDARREGRGERGYGRFSRREFLASAAAAGFAALGLAGLGNSLMAAPEDPEARDAGPAGEAKKGSKRAFTHRGKKVEIVEDATGADLTVDGKKVRAKKVSGMYRAPHFAFLPGHTPEDLAKGMIDYGLALDAKAAGVSGASGPIAGQHAGGH